MSHHVRSASASCFVPTNVASPAERLPSTSTCPSWSFVPSAAPQFPLVALPRVPSKST
ncbi:hypothetical protein C8Q70DRAFT_1011131 [Cubamyces menziesii]|nr:hypothetical protein C8Q70DRAFT_1018156 [Cubamyces menziesii]KAI0656353.1 hypothetical protein C8Q70DRAFT_1011131 [Cubamyces menziesii]